MKHIIAVASGKGGVGKSTIAVNLALGLARLAEKPRVALVDIDFYGPSIPTLMGRGELYSSPAGKIVPPEREGVKYISIGFFLRNEDDPVIWRGPMFSKAIDQLFNDVEWGDIDFAVVDLPPGTGDAQLSLAQQVKLSGAVVVTTPQSIAVADVQKAINMLRKVQVPVLGIVENMAGFVAPDGKQYNIFGSGGGQLLAEKYNVPLLGSIPIDPQIVVDSDSGMPTVLKESSMAAAKYSELAAAVARRVKELRPPGAGLRVVN